MFQWTNTCVLAMMWFIHICFEILVVFNMDRWFYDDDDDWYCFYASNWYVISVCIYTIEYLNLFIMAIAYSGIYVNWSSVFNLCAIFFYIRYSTFFLQFITNFHFSIYSIKLNLNFLFWVRCASEALVF